MEEIARTAIITLTNGHLFGQGTFAEFPVVELKRVLRYDELRNSAFS